MKFLICLYLITVTVLYQYYQDYLRKSNEISLYHSFVMPPFNCGPQAKRITEIGWIEWSGYTLWKQQQPPEKDCLLYVSKVTQTPWPNLFLIGLKTVVNILDIPWFILNSYLFWMVTAFTLPVPIFFHYYSASPAVALVPQNWISQEMKQIFNPQEIGSIILPTTVDQQQQPIE